MNPTNHRTGHRLGHHYLTPLAGALALLLVLAGCRTPTAATAPAGPDALVHLRAGGTELGLLPAAGGRVVLLRRGQGPNLLQADTIAWTPGAKLPDPAPATGGPDLQGQIIWVSPQSGWWTQQTINEDRRSRAAVWPPDPWLEYGHCEVTQADAASATLTGPASPITGLQLTRRFTVLDDGRVQLETTASNCRATPVTWGLWSNTRLPAATVVCAPLGEGRLRAVLDTKAPATDSLPHWTTADGLLRLDGRPLPRGDATATVGKLQLWPATPWVVAVGQGYLWRLSVTDAGTGAPHKDQAPVELFLRRARAEAGVLEVEFQGAYAPLAPGASVVLREEWQVWPYDGPPTLAGVGAFLQAHGLPATPSAGERQ